MKPLVAVIMGSTSDWATMKAACLVLEELGISYEKRVISAHRTPDLMFLFAEESRTKGLKVLTNAGLLAAEILSIDDLQLAERIQARRQSLEKAVVESGEQLE